jgi:hypothetical protein
LELLSSCKARGGAFADQASEGGAKRNRVRMKMIRKCRYVRYIGGVLNPPIALLSSTIGRSYDSSIAGPIIPPDG